MAITATSGQFRPGVPELTDRPEPLASDGLGPLKAEGDSVGRSRPPGDCGTSGSRVVVPDDEGARDDRAPDGSGVDGKVGTGMVGKSAPGRAARLSKGAPVGAGSAAASCWSATPRFRSAAAMAGLGAFPRAANADAENAWTAPVDT